MKSRSASSSSRSPLVRAVSRGAGEVRIIGGDWRRSRLTVAERPGLRPTPDRVRETLFNWLGQSMQGWRCADVFAGTGALGLEAASRGAKEVVLCEQDPSLVQHLKANVTRLHASQVLVRQGDGLQWVSQQAGANWDLIFLDPPFASALFEPALNAAAAALVSSGYVYLEAPEAWTTERLAAQGWTLYRHLKAGAVHAHLLRPAATVGAA